MKKKKKRKGICTSCINEAQCTYPKGNGSGVIQCDEFDAENCVSGYKVPKKIRAGQGSRIKPSVSTPSSLKGLCSNCENCQTCTYPKPEGGVWHCEEYQ